MSRLEDGYAAEGDRSFEYALDALPCNAMFCDRELILRYLNRASRKTLLSLQQHLPVPVDQIVGKSIHIFHKAPDQVEKILGGKQNHGGHKLPHKATIELGPVKLDLNVEPMIDERGEYCGAVVLWGVSTQNTIEALRKAQEAQRADIEHLDGNLQMVATATHEIESSIAEIARNAVSVAEAAEQSRNLSVESKSSILSLRASSNGVAKVADLIASIATQTSVLALNANIEAARAGVHGKGSAWWRARYANWPARRLRPRRRFRPKWPRLEPISARPSLQSTVSPLTLKNCRGSRTRWPQPPKSNTWRRRKWHKILNTPLTERRRLPTCAWKTGLTRG